MSLLDLQIYDACFTANFIYARVLYASEMIAIHQRVSGGTLTAIKAKHKGANIFTFVSRELRGGRCSSSAGCPEGILLHGWCRGHGVMWL